MSQISDMLDHENSAWTLHGGSRTLTVKDTDNVLASLQNGDPVTMKDAVLMPIDSQKRKQLIATINHFEVQLGRLAKVARDMRAEILSLTVK